MQFCYKEKKNMMGLGDFVGSPVDWSNPDYSTPTDITYSNVPSIYSTPSSGRTNWANLIGAAGSAFTNIFKTIQPLPAGCISVAGPYGMSQQCGGNQPTLAIGGTTLGSSLGNISPMLLIGGAVVLVMMMKK
jgi:hypothetical protein